jgi:3-methyladenine DNA glycosylase/8-oxoguanine DNA glycosylase
VSGAPREAELRFDGALDLAGTVAPLLPGPGPDPTLRVAHDEIVRASATPEGPGTLQLLRAGPGLLRARAWGEGADWLLARAGDFAGLGDAPPSLPAGAPAAVRGLAREGAGVRLARTHRVVEALVPVVLGQLVSGAEASRAHRTLVRAFSARAPGPFDDLWLPLSAERLRAIPAAAFPAAGALARQGATLHEIARRAARLEEAAAMDADAGERRLRAIPGVGVWTARMVLLNALGHADVVPLGDYGLPRHVAYALTGDDGPADDERLLELLEPVRGQRGLVVRWIVATAATPARRGPRMAMRAIHPDAPRALAAVKKGAGFVASTFSKT